MEPAGETVLA